MDWTRRHAIGHGSTATVSLATSIPSGDVFAVKSTHLSKSEFLQREQKILSSLNSPHIVSCKGCDITSENCQLFYNLFMEYAPGGSLADMIHRHGGRLDESMIASYTRQILQGLEYLHSSGLVHCDIKGRNILIGEDGAKVADFGCAKWEAEERQSGGTPMFMAPEVARGEHQGVSSDIWALGCTVIEMASGGVPWPDATDPVSVLYRIAYSCELPEFPGFLSNQAKDFLSKCLRRDPKERWTATQLLKHPFLREFSSSTKQIQASNSISNSPTSILDQDIWNSVEESLGNSIHASPQSSVSERIRRLTCSDGPSWNWDERWMTIRGNNEENNAIMNDIEGKDDMICGSVLDSFCGSLEEKESYVNGGKLLDFLNDNISYRKISRFCTYKNDCVVISSNLNFRRDTDSLLIPSIKGRISNEYTENYTHAVFKRFQRKEDLVKFYGNSFYVKVVKEHVTLYCHGMINVDFESEVEDDILPIFVKERVQRWCRICASNQQQLLRVHLVDLQKRHWHHSKN